jgi:NADH:ubiquinone oxidoreductase subunit F (NADH-binding)/NADH:ubiquinone oxidoreductase subunit E
MLIQELREIQERNGGYIPEAELYALAQRLKKPKHELYGVASFYPEFRFSPPPKATIRVCTALPCYMKGAERLYRMVRREASKRGDVEVSRCPCLGRCDGAPAITIDHHVHAHQTARDLYEISLSAMAGHEVPDQDFGPVALQPFSTDPYGKGEAKYGALRALVQRIVQAQEIGADAVKKVREDVLARIKEANLRGMGGAGKPVSRKLEQVFGEKSDEKYVVCNADESEPGTLKDREILLNFRYLLVESMTIVALTLGAQKGYIYIRHEYKQQADILRQEIHWAKTHGLLGENVLGSGMPFDLEVFVSPGGYVMGEMTALLEAIEGKRGQPRNQIVDLGMKKALPSFQGLWGKPTLVSNVETYIHIPTILHRGPEYFKGQGVRGCQGLKWASVCGDVMTPGVFEVPMGTTYREMLEKAGGPRGVLKAFAPSGPSFPFLPTTDQFLDSPMDFRPTTSSESNPVIDAGAHIGSGAILFLNDGRCMIDAALNFTRFFRNESCGKCVPCRVGSQKMVDIIKELRAGTPNADYEVAKDTIRRLSDVLEETSICGLGKVVPKPMQSVLQHFQGEVEAHVKRRECPANVCFTKEDLD